MLSKPKLLKTSPHSISDTVEVDDEKLPVAAGNYFSLAENVRVMNMWWENFSPIRKSLEGGVLCRVYANKWAIVVDDRIPEEYLNKSLCFDDVARPPESVISEMRVVLNIKEPIKKTKSKKKTKKVEDDQPELPLGIDDGETNES